MEYRRAGWGIGGVAAFAGVVFACSSPGPLYPGVSDFCAAYAKAACQESQFCITQPATCQTEQAAICASNAATAMQDGNRVYTPANAPACVNQAQTTFLSPQVSFAQTSALTTTCANVFVGSIQLGGACASSYDCANAATGVICDQKICVQPKTVNPGPTGFCGQPGEVCAGGSYCNTAGAPAVCTLSATDGQPCSPAVPCGTSFRCVGNPGTCRARATQGQSCASNSDCDPSAPFCDAFDGFICATGVIFSHGETALCQNYGGGSATPFDAGAPPVVVGDSGPAADSAPAIDSATPSDSGGGG